MDGGSLNNYCEVVAVTRGRGLISRRVQGFSKGPGMGAAVLILLQKVLCIDVHS